MQEFHISRNYATIVATRAAQMPYVVALPKYQVPHFHLSTLEMKVYYHRQFTHYNAHGSPAYIATCRR